MAPHALKKPGAAISVILGLFGASFIILSFVDSLPWNAEAAPAAAGLMLVGSVMRKYNFFDNPEADKRWTIVNTIVALANLVCFQVAFTCVGMFSGGRLTYKLGTIEVFVTLICGILGTVFMMNVSKWLVKARRLGAFLAYVGQNSLVILIHPRPDHARFM